MAKTRKLNTLYGLVLNHLQSDRHFMSDGVCCAIHKMTYDSVISKEEKDKVLNHFKSNRPSTTKHKIFQQSVHFTDMVYWWSRDKEGQEQRVLFIKTLFEQTKPWWTRFWWI